MEEFTRLVRDTALLLLIVLRFIRTSLHPILPPTLRMRQLHNKVRRILFSPEPTFTANQMPTMLQHYITTSKTVDEKEIVAKFLVLIAASAGSDLARLQKV